jgi:PAS domain S-box-containing protein
VYDSELLADGRIKAEAMSVSKKRRRDPKRRKSVPESQLQSREMLDVITRQLAVAATRCSRDLRYLWASQEYANLLRRPLNEIVGRPIEKVLCQEVFQPLQQDYRRVLAGEKVHYEREMHLPGIGNRWIAGTYTPTFDAKKSVSGWVAVISDTTERKRAEEALRDSEERFSLAAQAGKMYSYDWRVGADEVTRSSEYGKILGLNEPARLTYKEFVNRIHPDDREAFLAAVASLTPKNPYSEATYRFMRAAGGAIWMKSSGRGLFDEKGQLQRVVGMAADVTDHKLAEEALSHMSGKLIQAQEQERIRIARELHDDIGQRLALLSVTLDQVRAGIANASKETRNQIGELRKQLMDVAADVHDISRELHPSTLEHLGLVRAAKSWCTQFGQRQGKEIHFTSRGVSDSLPENISLCLFRVLQEAVHNASKHSATKRIDVEMREDSGEIHLVVSDSGAGFDVRTAIKSGGLGLMSMQERVRLVNGSIQIDSTPNSGTTLHARVPFDAERAA